MQHYLKNIRATFMYVARHPLFHSRECLDDYFFL